MGIKQGIKIVRSAIISLEPIFLEEFYYKIKKLDSISMNTKNLIMNTSIKKERIFAKFMNDKELKEF